MTKEKKDKKEKKGFMSMFGFKKMTKDMGIDLGTANTLVYIKGEGIVVREPSVVAIRDDSKEVLAVGEEAKKMIGRTPGNIVATEVEKRAIEEAARTAGARDAYLIEEPMAAAIGAGLRVEEPEGNMVVDIGGGTTEIAIISLGGIVTAKSIRIGGDEFDESIVSYVKKTYNLAIGERTAEDVKISIGSTFKDDQEQNMQIRGRDLISGLPKTIEISSAEVRDALNEPINSIVDAIKSTLEKTPPELASDIMENGIMLTGGGALLRGLDKLVKQETGMPVQIAENPLDCVALGTGKSVEDQEIFEKVLMMNARK